MHSYCINKLLNIEDIIVKNAIHFNDFVKILIETKPHPQIYPRSERYRIMPQNFAFYHLPQIIFFLPFLAYLAILADNKLSFSYS